MHIKTFKDRQRFESEIRFYELFREVGFLVPERLSVQPQNMKITYTKILGSHPDGRHVGAIAALIARAHEKILWIFDGAHARNAVLNKYLHDVQQVLEQHGVQIGSIRELISQNFFVSIFKDSKPENWIVCDDGRIFMLDFDYLVPSAPLQDMAQFLTGLWINDTSQQDASIIFSGFELLLQNEPWTTQFEFCSGDKIQIFAAACLLTLARKQQYSDALGKMARIRMLENVILPCIHSNSNFEMSHHHIQP